MDPISVQNEEKQKLALGFAHLVIDKSILYEHVVLHIITIQNKLSSHYIFHFDM